jgi:hypothetical protein
MQAVSVQMKQLQWSYFAGAYFWQSALLFRKKYALIPCSASSSCRGDGEQTTNCWKQPEDRITYKHFKQGSPCVQAPYYDGTYVAWRQNVGILSIAALGSAVCFSKTVSKNYRQIATTNKLAGCDYDQIKAPNALSLCTSVTLHLLQFHEWSAHRQHRIRSNVFPSWEIYLHGAESSFRGW